MLVQKKIIDFEDIVDSLEKEARSFIDETLRQRPAREKPTLIHMLGIPGSGKTTYVGGFVEKTPGYTVVQFDTVMESLSGYRHDCAELGAAEAFRRWELKARTIGYHLLQACLERRVDVIFDHGALFHSHVELLRKARRLGYRIEMHFCPLSPKIALERVARRERLIQRHTPESLIFERQEVLLELLPVYRELVDLFLEVSSER
jgi:predicted ABC-type ATPase